MGLGSSLIPFWRKTCCRCHTLAHSSLGPRVEMELPSKAADLHALNMIYTCHFPRASFLSTHDLSFAQTGIKGMRQLPVILVCAEAVTTDHYSGNGGTLSKLGQAPNSSSSLVFPPPLHWASQSPGHHQGVGASPLPAPGQWEGPHQTPEESTHRPRKPQASLAGGGTRVHLPKASHQGPSET